MDLDKLDAQIWNDESFATLAKDSVSDGESATDVIAAKEVDAFLARMLKQMLAAVLWSVKKQKLAKGRSFIEALFADTKYHGDSVLDLTIKHDKKHYLNKFLEIIQKCRLQNVLQFTNEYNENCLHIACAHERAEQLRLLIKNGNFNYDFYIYM